MAILGSHGETRVQGADSMSVTTGEDTRCCTEECGNRINVQTLPSGLSNKDSNWGNPLKEGKLLFRGFSYTNYKNIPLVCFRGCS